MSAFTDAVARLLDGLEPVSAGLAPGCSDCGLEDVTDTDDPRWEEAVDEGSFSWGACDGCGSVLGGDRYAAHGWLKPDGEEAAEQVVHLNVCVDCIQYIANGTEPEEWSGR